MRAFPAIALMMISGTALAAPVSSFVETFDADNAAWADAASTPATWDAGGFITANVDLATADPQNGALLFRAEDSLDSSGDAFVGDWLAGGITSVEIDVRHDSAVPVSYYVRVAPAFGPGMLFLNFAPVAAGQWTTLSFDFSSSNPGWIPEGTQFNNVASGIAKFQIGAIPAGASTQVATFDIDNVRLVPAPASAALLGLGGLAATRRRR